MSTIMLKRNLGTGDLCDNIGSLVYLQSGAVSLHHLAIITKRSLSCLLCMLAIPIFPFLKVKEFLIYLYGISNNYGHNIPVVHNKNNYL